MWYIIRNLCLTYISWISSHYVSFFYSLSHCLINFYNLIFQFSLLLLLCVFLLKVTQTCCIHVMGQTWQTLVDVDFTNLGIHFLKFLFKLYSGYFKYPKYTLALVCRSLCMQSSNSKKPLSLTMRLLFKNDCC